MTNRAEQNWPEEQTIELIPCHECGNLIPYEWNARGMTRCVQCHLLFENSDLDGTEDEIEYLRRTR